MIKQTATIPDKVFMYRGEVFYHKNFSYNPFIIRIKGICNPKITKVPFETNL